MAFSFDIFCDCFISLCAKKKMVFVMGLVPNCLKGGTIYWINHHPVDNSIGFSNSYQIDTELSTG